jgi:lycopene cyclase domain-containing protein
MTYFQFHLVFTVPLLVVMAVAGQLGWVRRPKSLIRWAGILTLVVIAILYTVPWEVILIAEGVWSYGEGVVTRHLWGVPYGELMFIVIQTVVVGWWGHHWLDVTDWPRDPAGQTEREAPTTVWGRWPWSLGAMILALGIAALVAGERMTYLGGLLVWAGPVLAVQWSFGWGILTRHWRLLVIGVVPPSLYFWVVDALAIRWGVWTIAPSTSTGVEILGLPIEEALFFVLTNTFVIQGVMLWSWIVERAGVRSVGKTTPVHFR